MPLFLEKIEPVKQIEQIEIQPSIDKIENFDLKEIFVSLDLVII
jgi:hypothetical protein